MKLIGIKGPRGLYVSDNVDGKGYHHTNLAAYVVNGVKPVHTFHVDWWFVEGAETIESLTRMCAQPNNNYRYELCDLSFQREGIPSVITEDDMIHSSEYGWRLKDEMGHLESLYNLVSDERPKIEKDFEFSLTIVLEMTEEPIDYGRFAYPKKKKLKADPQRYVANETAQHQLLDRILFPSLVLPSRPCKLTSQESYDLVREHVIRNINGDVARITSNYNFCFDVTKTVALAKPYSFQREQKTARGKSYKRRRFRNVYVNIRGVKVFEMTYAGAGSSGARGKSGGYRDYTVIKGFEGENERDLQENIEAYLEELMDIINAPLVDCPHCNGMGVIVRTS